MSSGRPTANATAPPIKLPFTMLSCCLQLSAQSPIAVKPRENTASLAALVGTMPLTIAAVLRRSIGGGDDGDVASFAAGARGAEGGGGSGIVSAADVGTGSAADVGAGAAAGVGSGPSANAGNAALMTAALKNGVKDFSRSIGSRECSACASRPSSPETRAIAARNP